MARPRLALPFTILTEPDTVRLVAGEDFRYTLNGPELDAWLPGWLSGLDGGTSLEEALRRLPGARQTMAANLAERLYGERVLIDGATIDSHMPAARTLVIEGRAGWAAAWQGTGQGTERKADLDCLPMATLPVLCQDRLDLDEALRFNRRCRQAGTPWLWASTGPMSRAYVGPLFLPDAGPCWSCLLYHFHRLSPVPELYQALTDHARAGKEIVPVPFPAGAAALLRPFVEWKASLATEPVAPAALYRLHVLEVATLEITSHRVFVDPECPECGGRK